MDMRAEDQQQMQDGIAKLNAMPVADLRTKLLQICGSVSWVESVIKTFPHTSAASILTAMDRAWWSLSRPDYLEAFAAHPRIGDGEALKKKFATVPKASGKAGPVWEADEQKGAEGADEKTLQSLVKHNKLYEERFGHIFLVCATGKTADEMLAILQDRMRNEPAYELTVAAGEQNKITALRLHKLLTFLGTREDSSRL
ncbi:hypothetical protein NSK_003227 [Nannochloropsis salina CCMP1776]|uniref:2-oxo-4-hydroxy-4-carboxy-5-ureidoimidazoline decarboxylase n=1 Tax=Nannochloropsis salina CCMP1776 TaxID=1027361 RepID=A0A4D9D6S9_9STRA|nr:hypothetical protein NSK_003227 [Nannochloropsis salina CCMP1776]|eukprot:TFJ85723.1 hypothetical protein NSK_003227 [Nannochloropsis salina CCMP1776]